MPIHKNAAPRAHLTKSDRTRIRQLLSVAIEDPSIVDSDIRREFGLSIDTAVRYLLDDQVVFDIERGE
jgi:hypothetical protein